MATTDAHEDAERRMREIVSDADLPPPDEVDHRPGEVVLMWHEMKLAVIVELDGSGPSPG